MLQSMREKTQGIIAGAIVILVAITFALWGIQYYTSSHSETGVIAKVNGENITEQQTRRVYSRLQQQRFALLGKDMYLDQQSQAKFKEQIIQQLIKNKVLSDFANKLKLYVGKEQLQATIIGMPAFQVDKAFSQARFEQMLRGLGYTESEFLQELQNIILLGQLDLGVTKSSFVLPSELHQAIKLIKQRRDFSYTLIDPQYFATDVNVSEEEIKQYYEQHKNKFIAPERVSIEYVELNANAVKDKISFSDEKLEQFYKTHPELFAKKNKEKSTTTSTLPPPKFAQVKDQVKTAYAHQMAQQLLIGQNDRLTDITYTNPNSLEPAAKELGLTIKTTEPFTNTGTTGGITSNPKIIKAAFSEAVLKQGYNSNAIDIADNDIVVLRIKRHFPEAFLPLDRIRDRIIAKIKRDKLHKIAKQHGEELLQDMQQTQTMVGPNLANLNKNADKNKNNDTKYKQYHSNWQTITNVTHQTIKQDSNNDQKSDQDTNKNRLDKRILDAAFNVPRSSNDKLNKSMITLVDLGDKGYALLKVTKVIDGDSNKISAKEQQAIHEALQKDWATFEHNLLTDEIMRQAKIKKIQDSNTTSTPSAAPPSLSELDLD